MILCKLALETSSIYIKMLIDTLQQTHTHECRQFHFQRNRRRDGGREGGREGWTTNTYRARKCHLLGRPASQWSPSSSSAWRTPAAQRPEPPHRWTCVTQGTSHGAGYTDPAMTHHREKKRRNSHQKDILPPKKAKRLKDIFLKASHRPGRIVKWP